MKRKILTLVLTLFVLINCAVLPFGAVYAEQATETASIDNMSADFNNMAVGSILHSEITAETGVAFGSNADTFDYEITENGALKITNNTAHGSLVADFNFSKAVETGTIVTEYATKLNLDYGMDNSDNVKVITFMDKNLLTYKVQSGFYTPEGIEILAAPETGAGNMFRFRTVVSRETTSEDWKFVAYCDTNKGEFKLLETTFSKGEYPSLAYTRFFNIYNWHTEGYPLTVTFDDFKVTYKTVEEMYNMNADFADMTAGSVQYKDITAETGVAFGKNADVFNYEITEDSTLEITNDKAHGSLVADFNFTGAVKTGAIVTEYATNLNSNYTMDNSDNVSVVTFMDKTLLTYKIQKGFYTPEGIEKLAEPSKTSGMYRFRTVALRETTNEDWKFVAYCDTNAGAVKLLETTFAKEDYPSLAYTRFFGLYNWNTAGSAFGMIFDDFNVSYKTVEEIYNMTADFNDIKAESVQHKDITAETGLAFGSNADLFNYETTENGALKITNDTAHGSLTADFNFMNAVKTGTVVTEYATKAYSDYGMDNSDNVSVIRFMDKTLLTYKNQKGFYTPEGIEKLAEPSVGAGDFFRFRTVVSRETTDEDWKFVAYFDTHKGTVKLLETTFAKEEYPSLTYTRFFGLYNWNTDDFAFKMTLDDFKVTYVEGSAIELGDVAITANGAAFDGATLPQGTTSVTAAVSAVNTAKTGEAITMVLGVYSENGRLLGVNAAIDQVPTETATDISATVTGINTEAGAYAKVMFFKDLTTIRPWRADGGLSGGF